MKSHSTYTEEIDRPISRRSSEINKKLITLRRSKRNKVETDQGLMKAIYNLCFYYNPVEKETLLISDQFIRIIQPYFKVCCQKFKVELIDIIRNSVLIAHKN